MLYLHKYGWLHLHDMQCFTCKVVVLMCMRVMLHMHDMYCLTRFAMPYSRNIQCLTYTMRNALLALYGVQ